jgi:hypothetical protein
MRAASLHYACHVLIWCATGRLPDLLVSRTRMIVCHRREDRRRIVHYNVTAHPTAEWTGRQLREAFHIL